MKRMLALLLALALCLALAACGGTGNESYDYILYLLEEGNYDMAIHVIEGLRDGNTDATQEVPAAYDHVIEQVPGNTGTDWNFIMDIVNDTPSTLILEAVVTTDYLDDQAGGTQNFEGPDLGILPLGYLVLEPGESAHWNDMRPTDYGFNKREYLHIFRDDQGQQVLYRFIFDMRGVMPDGSNATSMEQPAGDWHFPATLENTGNTPMELCALDITHLMNDEPLGTTVFEGEDLAMIGLGGLVLQPGEQFNYSDGHPVVPDWNTAEYRFHFVDGNGETQTLTFRFENLHEQSQTTDYSQDQGKDLKTLRHDADFEVEVHPGVNWVPAAMLGSSRYTNMDIHNMLSATPEEKQANISTLYEAIQLYQVGNFTPSDDNVRLTENGVNWEHHKPGYHAVRTNTGCCATDSNWLRYILDGDYDEVGYIATSQRDGSGHIYNYILQDGWYYVIDLTHYHASGSPMVTAVENGDLNAYRATDFVLGNIHKVRSISDYVDYVQEAFNDPPGLMFQYTAENCLAVDSPRSKNGVQIMYEEVAGLQISVIFDDPSDSLEFVRAKAPKNLPDWKNLP